MGKMLENDPIVDSLLAENPFRGKPPPKHVRARLVDDDYDYYHSSGCDDDHDNNDFSQ